eukprot:648517-Karenia_brevis.AAC.1
MSTIRHIVFDLCCVSGRLRSGLRDTPLMEGTFSASEPSAGVSFSSQVATSEYDSESVPRLISSTTSEAVSDCDTEAYMSN